MKKVAHKVYPTVIQFDGFVFPRVGHKLNWMLRYAQNEVTKEDMLVAASIIHAYDALVFKTQKKRNEICSVLQEHPIMAQVRGGNE